MSLVSALQTPSPYPLDPSLFHKASNREIRRTAITRGRRLKTCTCPSERPRSCRRSYRAPCLMGCSKNTDAVEGDTTTSDEEDEEVRTSSFTVPDVKSPAAAVASRRERYCLVACKPMGCISVSMSLHQTSLCFVCSHLASGEKEGNELRRNSDVIEILKNTQFRRLCKRSGRRIPERILDHE
ncbi:hypothetical protein BAE44_0011836 [Dichanthelium oligosanthes]|uniref:Inositol polyphosphate-related phosphatase domain-containing protein n=1 Tax=Dichanthelium oligosanthes TaxID=888268 RepID=A0A1E5VPS5_9POAL|nr:hypothetical protein BAE44_0011836 [Dichanthelium oligosanthes]